MTIDKRAVLKDVVGRDFTGRATANDKGWTAPDKLVIDWLKWQYEPHMSNIYDLLNSGSYKYMGWSYDFTPYMNRYIYKQHGQWFEVYAPNKTMLRKAVYGVVDKIILSEGV
tara:strand:- start:324 stop:659 length:336 start_codon:yes stop_codon:yes gene_type:complete